MITDSSTIPLLVKQAIDGFRHNGSRPGDFVYAVLTNNFFEAVMRADRDSREHLVAIAQYVYEEVPMKAWGSVGNVEAWIAEKSPIGGMGV